MLPLFYAEQLILQNFSELDISPVSIEHVAQHIRVPHKANCPSLILILSHCRSGSTALGRVFACSGYTYYHQPIKTILRHQYVGKELMWEMPVRGTPIIVKETFGPYLEQECCLDPLRILDMAGYPMGKIHIIMTVREPFSAFASWKHWWPAVRIENFIKAYHNTVHREREALSRDIAVTNYIFEAIKRHTPDVVIKKLFEKLGLTYADAAVCWHNSPAYGTADSHIVEVDQPDEFLVVGIRDQIKTSTQYNFVERDTRTLQHADICKIRKAGLLEVYEDFRRDCARDLALQT
jgi:hypothetical protein